MTGIPTEEVRGVVLAGGKSTRFGDEDKALAHFAGEPLVSRVVSTLRAATDAPPVLAAGNEHRATVLLDVLPKLPTVSDDSDFEGPIAGLLAAAARVSRPWIVVTGCDMPLVSGSAVRTLLDTADDEADAVVVVDESGHVDPLFAAFRTESVRRHRQDVLPTSGPRRLVEELGEVRTLSTESSPSLERAVTNVNTRRDLATLTQSNGGDDDAP